MQLSVSAIAVGMLIGLSGGLRCFRTSRWCTREAYTAEPHTCGISLPDQQFPYCAVVRKADGEGWLYRAEASHSPQLSEMELCGTFEASSPGVQIATCYSNKCNVIGYVHNIEQSATGYRACPNNQVVFDPIRCFHTSRWCTRKSYTAEPHTCGISLPDQQFPYCAVVRKPDGEGGGWLYRAEAEHDPHMSELELCESLELELPGVQLATCTSAKCNLMQYFDNIENSAGPGYLSCQSLKEREGQDEVSQVADDGEEAANQ